ncbi:MAG TPA: tetratricopeptide repeat protein [Myxococcales bacterium]|nr:tetratricopeptide repeat protein [Myxococcales bacterium]
MSARTKGRWRFFGEALCAAMLLAARPAAADARAEAKKHFQAGMRLIAAGNQEGGIAELKKAYAIKPHPVVLYDIGKAYLDHGDIPNALDYFRKYAATNPRDKDQVQAMIARLEASTGKTAEMEKLMAKMRDLIEKAQQPPAPEAKPGKAPDLQSAKPADDDLFEEQTISPRTATANGK